MLQLISQRHRSKDRGASDRAHILLIIDSAEANKEYNKDSGINQRVSGMKEVFHKIITEEAIIFNS
jgi:hypothetical protein